ncbi:MAG: zinc finger Ran-binding domain-containing protein [Actinomycetota bacterium]
MSVERRCPSCGGLATADAEWCGQCFAPLRPPAPEEPLPPAPRGMEPRAAPKSVPTPGGGGVEVAGGRATWDCPVCGERNQIEASLCSMCQTPFARLFEEPATGPALEPRTAALWSLLFAGLGHWKAGLRVDGFGRMVVFAWTFGTVIVVLISRPASGFGSAFTLFAVYVAAALAIYVLSAVDAYRVVAGDEPLVPSRTLLWACAALVLVSIALAMFVALPAARG